MKRRTDQLAKVRAEIARRDAPPAAPTPLTPAAGELWKHRRNDRVIRVTAVKSTVQGSRPTYLIEFHYQRDGVGNGGVGWKRNVLPTQAMMIDEWRGFFTERVAEAANTANKEKA